MGNDGGAIYGGFWRRGLAALLDIGLIILLLAAAGFLLGIISGVTGQDFQPSELVVTILPIALLWLYETLTTAGDKHATPGKRAVGLEVVDATGHPLSWGRANVRFWSKALSAAIALIGFLMVAFNRQKLGLHDLIAGTRVVRQQASAADLAQPAAKGLRPVNAFLILLSVLIILPFLLFVDDTGFRLFSTSPSKLQEMAAEGDAEAQHDLGSAYLKGKKGLDRNIPQAVKWFRRAGEQGVAYSQYNLGLIYRQGMGEVARDESKAVQWFRKAAEQGNPRAQHALGKGYVKGQIGLARNASKGVEWLTKAAEQGSANAQYNLGLVYRRGMGEVAKDEAKAAQWFREAAEQGNPRAQFLLAEMLIKGKGVRPDRAQGMEWLKKSANQGFEKAQKTLKSSQD